MIPIHLLKEGGMQFKPDYLTLNPSAQVPCLVDDELTLGQSMAIVEYLEEVYTDTPLLPKAAQERAIVRQMCEVINSGIQPLQNLSVILKLGDTFSATADQKKQWIQDWVGKGLDSFNKLVSKHGGQYCFGDQITLADCFLVPQIFSSKRFEVDVNQFPKLVEIDKKLNQLPEFIKASPEKQPDFE